jgi:hypothetical protein
MEPERWRRIVGLAVPGAVLFFTLGFIVALEVQRGPNWRLELEGYVDQERSASETIAVEDVSEARKPWNFVPAMGTPTYSDGVSRTLPPEAVRCVLVARTSTADSPSAGPRRQVIFLVRHSDRLYQVGWSTYEGPVEPFEPDLMADLAALGCELNVGRVEE